MTAYPGPTYLGLVSLDGFWHPALLTGSQMHLGPPKHMAAVVRHCSTQPQASCRKNAVYNFPNHAYYQRRCQVAATSDMLTKESKQQTIKRPERQDTIADDNFEVPQDVHDKNAALVAELRGQLILAPLTRGGNLPFRRLCSDYGATVTMSEMAFARQLIKGDRVERARLHKAPNEHCFGVQVATKAISEGVAAAKLAKGAGARWLDINCGCPISEATRRGMGAAMLRKPRALAKLVNAMAREAELPITVKVRTGVTAKDINVDKVVGLLHAAGAAAVTVHGRTMEQRYKRAADWELIRTVAANNPIPIIGNGDILTQYEAADRLANYGCTAALVGRGALIKPWIFQEVRQGREMRMTTSDRVAVCYQLVAYMKEHFRDDARGRRAAMYFLPLNLSFLARYRHLPQDVYGAASKAHPLILTRMPGVVDPQIGETEADLAPLERLLRCMSEAAHAEIADALWDSTSEADAQAALAALAAPARLVAWELDAQEAEGRGGGENERGGGRQDRRDSGGDQRDAGRRKSEAGEPVEAGTDGVEG